MKSPLLNALADFIFPPLCHCCRTYIPNSTDIHICDECLAKMLPVTSPLCPRCGIPFKGDGDNHLCGKCIKTSSSFLSARAAFIYDGKISELIHRFKYTPKPHLRKPLALLIAQELLPYKNEIVPELIIPVPLHKKRLRQRGFNQAVLLGELLSEKWQLPLLRFSLQRTRWTEPQVSLSALERHENVKGAFAVTDVGKIYGKRILLVDDVFTTGSTLNECARTLILAGAEEVHCVSVARAITD